MTIYRKLYYLFTTLTAISAFIAAAYWFASSRPEAPPMSQVFASIDDNPALHILSSQVEIANTQAALREASRLNKWASIWSGIAALCGAIVSILGVL